MARRQVDLGTWIGEPEENRAWELLGRGVTNSAGLAPRRSAGCLRGARGRGSDWFWWFGEDQDSGTTRSSTTSFRTHLKNIYRDGCGAA
jgi:alpha-amylase/alpha-mannosidase (GH57 family)